MQCSKILGYSSDSNRQKCLPSWSKRLQIISNAHNKDINSALNLIKKKENVEFFMEDQKWHVSVIKAGLTKKVIFKERQRRGSKLLQFVQSLSCVQLFATPWTAARQASLSITNSQSLLKLMSIESVMPSSHLIFCHPSHSPLPLNLSQHQELLQWVSSMHQMAKVLEFQLQHQSFQCTPRTDLL